MADRPRPAGRRTGALMIAVVFVLLAVAPLLGSQASSMHGPTTHAIEVKFDYDGGGSGKGGKVTLLRDGKAIGDGRVEKTVPGIFSFDDFLDVG